MRDLARTPRPPSRLKLAMEAIDRHMQEAGLRAGDSLPSEAYFALQLAISRSVVREAFRSLAATNRIEIVNGRRARVAPANAVPLKSAVDHALITKQLSMPEVWEFRRHLELRTVELAATHRTDEEAERIVALADLVGTESDLEKGAHHDAAFHDAIAAASGNRLFLQVYRAIGPMVQTAIRGAWNAALNPAIILPAHVVFLRDDAYASHRDAAAAIRDRDPVAAIKAFERHFPDELGAALWGAGAESRRPGEAAT